MPDEFKSIIEAIVNQIPSGRFMTYGQLAALAGHPRAARIVGGVAHFGDPSLPWHRVVNKKGNLASGYPGGREEQRRQIEAEGIKVLEMRIDIANLIWWP